MCHGLLLRYADSSLILLLISGTVCLSALSVTTHFQHSLISLAWFGPDSRLVASLYLSVFISSSRCSSFPWLPFYREILLPLTSLNTSICMRYLFYFSFFGWKILKQILVFVIESDLFISLSRHSYYRSVKNY